MLASDPRIYLESCISSSAIFHVLSVPLPKWLALDIGMALFWMLCKRALLSIKCVQRIARGEGTVNGSGKWSATGMKEGPSPANQTASLSREKPLPLMGVK